MTVAELLKESHLKLAASIVAFIITFTIFAHLHSPSDRPIPWKNDEGLEVPAMSFAVEPYLSSFRDQRLLRLHHESDFQYVTRVNKVVHRAFYHCTPGDSVRNIEKYALLLLPKRYSSEGFLDPRFSRCGFCHQAAFILSYVLSSGGIPSSLLGLNGHVVALVTIKETQFIFDPDFGVGGIDYTDYDLIKIQKKYAEVDKWWAPLRRAYLYKSDDYFYYDMKWLIKVMKLQNLMIFFLELISSAAVVLAAIWFGRQIYKKFLDVN
jgi:hypothetical protein